MNIVLTGSMGHISKPLAAILIAKGHSVTIISSKEAKRKEIEAAGAVAAIGSIDDPDFLTALFRKADIAYLMEPPFPFFDQNIDPENYWLSIARTYAKAVTASGLTKIIHLSSIGAHTDQGVGMLRIHHYVENILQELPAAVSIKTMRPVGFYYNMFAYIPAIKNAGAIIQNYGGDEKEPWVSPIDIASVIAEEMETAFQGRTVRYIVSDEVSPNDVSAILGEAIGKPDLKWLVVPDEQFRENLLKTGFNPAIAKGLTDMNAGRRNDLYADYQMHKPEFGKIKLTDFAREFAAAYHQHTSSIH